MYHGCNLQRLELQYGIISKWITIIYFWFKCSKEHDLPVESEKKRLGASHVPRAPCNATVLMLAGIRLLTSGGCATEKGLPL